jgi:hypothetical protein
MIRSPSRRLRRRPLPQETRRELAIAPVVHDQERDAAGITHAFLLTFPESDHAVAVVLTDDPDHGNSLDVAWAFDCNPGGCAWILELPPWRIKAAGVPLFTLLHGSEADDAVIALGLVHHHQN